MHISHYQTNVQGEMILARQLSRESFPLTFWWERQSRQHADFYCLKTKRLLLCLYIIKFDQVSKGMIDAFISVMQPVEWMKLPNNSALPVWAPKWRQQGSRFYGSFVDENRPCKNIWVLWLACSLSYFLYKKARKTKSSASEHTFIMTKTSNNLSIRGTTLN